MERRRSLASPSPAGTDELSDYDKPPMVSAVAMFSIGVLLLYVVSIGRRRSAAEIARGDES